MNAKHGNSYRSSQLFEHAPRRKDARARFNLDSLEPRVLFSTYAFDPGTGVLTITGTDRTDEIYYHCPSGHEARVLRNLGFDYDDSAIKRGRRHTGSWRTDRMDDARHVGSTCSMVSRWTFTTAVVWQMAAPTR